MTPISEIIFSGFVSKAVNNCVDVSWDKIKKAVKNKRANHQNLESRIYNVTVDVLNSIADNQFKSNQDNIYYSAEILLKSFKDGEENELGHIKSCLRMLGSNVDEDKCIQFKILLYETLGKNEYSELFRTILLLLLEQNKQYDHYVYEQIIKILNEAETKIDKLDLKFDTINSAKEDAIIRDNVIKFQNNKKQDYIDNWNSRLFLHIDNDERPLTLADTFIMPRFEHNDTQKGRINFAKKDTMRKAISKFIKYDRSANMLITGAPGIGKTSIVSWVANEYKENDNIIILRFRDWERDELDNGLFKAICNILHCSKRDLENKVIIMDGYDEIKVLDEGENQIINFFNDILDYKNFKVIITSRTDYINPYLFQYAINMLPFGIIKVKRFYHLITGQKTGSDFVCNNLDVLGIPVILYMAIMSDIDITKEITKPELYSRIFAEKGGIFDKFSFCGVGYDYGIHVLRDINNIKKYLEFLQKIAFEMFEKGTLRLQIQKCKLPKLRFEGNDISVLEFPIKYLFEYSMDFNIEFIHKSIYEYFVSEYILVLISKIKSDSLEGLAKFFANKFKFSLLSKEILEFLKYNVKKRKLLCIFDKVRDTFYIMLQDGLTYDMDANNKKAAKFKMNIFANMLELIHIWDRTAYNFENSILKYLKFDNQELNLSKLDFNNTNLRQINLKYANLRGAIFKNANLSRSNLSSSCLEEANLGRANLSKSYLNKANLNKANLSEADLNGADLRGAKLDGVCMKNANMSGTIIDESQVYILEETCDLQDVKIFMKDLHLISYEEYCHRNERI